MAERRGSLLYEVLIGIATGVLLLILLLPRFSARSIAPEIRRAEAEHRLTQIYDQQIRYHLIRGMYAASLDSLSFRLPEKSIFSYELVAANDTSFVVRARASTDFNKNARFETWTINQNKDIVLETPD